MQSATLIVLSTVFVMFWSSGWIVSRVAIDDLSVTTLLTARYAIVFIVALVLVTLLGSWRRLSTSTIACHLLIGMLSHAAYLLAAIGAFELGISAALVAFVTALQPMTTAALSGLITRERTTQRQWQGLLIGLSAVSLLVSDSYRHGMSAYALCLPFISVLALSVGSLLNRRLELDSKRKGAEAVPVTLILLIQCVGALCVFIPLSSGHGPVIPSYGGDQWAALIWLALVVSLGSYAVLQLLLRHMNCMQVSSLSYLVPPATMMQAYMVFGDTVSMMDMAGLAVAALGVYLVMKPARVVQRQRISIESHRQVDIEL